MEQNRPARQNYICPMHREIRQTHAGKCPRCEVDLVPEGARFGMLWYVIQDPLMVAGIAFIFMVVMLVGVILSS